MSNITNIDGKIRIRDNNDTDKFVIDSDGSLGTASTDLLGFYGVTPSARPTALAQTYATAALTHAVLTATSVATTAPTGSSPKGFSTTAQAGALFRAVNALIVDVRNNQKFVNKVVDQLQAQGLLQ